MKQIQIQTFDLLKTGDLVFYRPMRDTRTLGWMYDKIRSWFYRSLYVDIGVLQWTDGLYNVVGSNGTVELRAIIEDRDVDIYRLTKDSNTRLEYDSERNMIALHTYRFDGNFVAMKVREQWYKHPHWTNRVRFWLGQLFAYDKFSNDHQIMKVVNCATVLEYAFNEAGFDFCPRVSPNYATIDKISGSPLIDYLFTLTQCPSTLTPISW